MRYRIDKAVAHPDHTLTVRWSDGAQAAVDMRPIVAKGKVFGAMQDPRYFVERMQVSEDKLGIEWPNDIDFSADGLRCMAFPDEAEEQLAGIPAEPKAKGSPA